MTIDDVLMPKGIRLADAADAPAIGGIALHAWQWAYRGILADALLDSLRQDQFETFWARALSRAPDERRVWVLNDEDRVLGFAATGPRRDDDLPDDVFELYAINLEPAAVGKGLGRALVSHAVDDLTSRGFPTATLWVLKDNLRARRFYEVGGWRPDGTERIDRDWFPGFELHDVRYLRDLG